MVKDSKFEKSGAGKVRAWSWNVLQLRLNRIGKYWWRSRCFWNQICENPGWKVGGGFFIGSHTKFGIFSRRNSNCLSRRFGMFYRIILTTGFWGKEAWCPTPKWNTRWFFFCIFQTNLAMAILGLREMGKFLWEGREKGLPCWLSQFSKTKMRQPTG